MARLAESSVVIAFRDWQWLTRTADAVSPPLMIVMEGNPESKLGDLQIAASERFFLFEVKSTEKTIIEEWSKTKPNGDPNPKQLFKKLCSVLDSAGQCFDSRNQVLDQAKLDEQIELINKSIACHHFLYWNEENSDFQIEPYYFGCKRKKGLTEEKLELAEITISNKSQAVNILSDFKLGLSRSPLWQDEEMEIHFNKISFINPKMLNDKSARLISGCRDGAEYHWQFLGLEFEEFQKYVNELCGNVAYYTNCILLSSSGKIFAHMVDTADLLSLVEAIAPHMMPPEPPSDSEYDGTSTGLATPRKRRLPSNKLSPQGRKNDPSRKR